MLSALGYCQLYSVSVDIYWHSLRLCSLQGKWAVIQVVQVLKSAQLSGEVFGLGGASLQSVESRKITTCVKGSSVCGGPTWGRRCVTNSTEEHSSCVMKPTSGNHCVGQQGGSSSAGGMEAAGHPAGQLQSAGWWTGEQIGNVRYEMLW